MKYFHLNLQWWKTSDNNTKKDTIVVSSSAVDEAVVVTRNTKDVNVGLTSIDTGTSSMSESNGTLNDATPRTKEVASPSVVDDIVDKYKISTVVTTTESYPPLPTQVATSVGNAPGKSSYANVTGKPSGKKLNFHTLFTPGGNGIDVVVPVDSSTRLFSFQFSSMDELDAMIKNVWIKLHGVPVTAFSEDGLSAIATKLGTSLMLDSYTADMCMQSWGMSSYARAMIELRAAVELKDNIVATMPKITGEGYYTCNIRVEYEWKTPRCACCKVFVHVLDECTKNIGAGATKNLKKTSQTPKGILRLDRFCGFNLITVSHLDDNDVNLGTDGGISNSADKGTNNVSFSNTPIGEKIDKIERQICEGKIRISASGKEGSDKGYGTNSLLEKWSDSYQDNDDYAV
ncbi:putative reverse transcriptase domain-containing protein [Tanacetum coccineum]